MNDTTNETKETKTPKTKAPKVPKETISSVANESLRTGATNSEVLEAVLEKFPEAKTSLASVNWYRNKLRSDGEDIPTSRELRKQNKTEVDPIDE